MKNLTVSVVMTILAAATFTSCSKDADVIQYDGTIPQQEVQKAKAFGMERTVLVYMAGRNNLSIYATADLNEMLEGSKKLADDQALVVFMRRCNNGEEPWLARIQNGQLTDKVTLKDMGIDVETPYASDPEVMEKVMKYTFGKYPSINSDYGLVLWGHGSGWLMEKEVEKSQQSRGYGVDLGNYIYSMDGKWINIPTMNNVLAGQPHLKFIFADCCNFMCLESLYELRQRADYIIGSPAEIPAEGAPYDEVVPAMFETSTFYTSILDRYHQSVNGQLPLSVVKTSEMETVAQATKKVFMSMVELEDEFPNMEGMIHYNYLDTELPEFHAPYNIFFDAGNFIQSYATAAEYQQWKQALDAAVIDKRFVETWQTNKAWSVFFSDFEMTEKNYHGVSIFIPQDPTIEYGERYEQLNEDITKMQWYKALE